jgi:16S rRNA (guanine(966)-N(2))-methyltransferase RsmD
MIRIIAGRFRSRKLKTLPGNRTRPTSDRLRETLFNVIGPKIEGALFLDCYAGSGAVGVEAISRGAKKACFIEAKTEAVQVILGNIESLEISYNEEAEVFSLGVTRAFKALETQNVRFDIVFIDPPYDATDEYDRALQWLGTGTLLAPDALVIAEHVKRHTLAEAYGSLHCSRTLTQGDATLSFFDL